MQELYSILAMRSGLSGQAAIKASTGRMEASVKETANTLFAAADMTRVAAIMLWTLLALVKRRVEDLLRLDKVLTGFMKVWQNRAAAEASALLCDVMVRCAAAIPVLSHAGKRSKPLMRGLSDAPGADHLLPSL